MNHASAPFDARGEGLGASYCETLAELTRSVIFERALFSRTTHVTRSLRSVFGHDPAVAEAGGLEWWIQQVHEDDVSIVRGRLGRYEPGRPREWSVQYRVKRADGSWAIVHDRGRTLDATDQLPARVVGIISDISHVRALQQQLLHAQTLELVGQLSAGVAHDFNNVLAAIGGFTAVALEGLADSDSRAEDLRQVERLVARAAGLAENLLGLTRQRSDGNKRFINVADELRRLVPTLRMLIGGAIDLSVDVGSVDFTTAMEPGMLDQVVLNLAANARDATPSGGRIHLQCTSADTGPGPRVRVAVSDSGTGIPPHVMTRIFEPFFTTKSNQRGTGIGLWLVREIVQGAEGTITVTSTPAQGTTVLLDLPGCTEPPSGDPRVKSATPRTRAVGRTVLLIEDEDAVRNVTRRILERQGYRVIEASTGHDGLEQLRRSRTEIDLVITDLHMPGLDGPELVALVRQEAPEIGCLVMTGLPERVAHTLAPADRFAVLGKPCDTDVLLNTASSLARATVSRRATGLVRVL